MQNVYLLARCVMCVHDGNKIIYCPDVNNMQRNASIIMKYIYHFMKYIAYAMNLFALYSGEKFMDAIL